MIGVSPEIYGMEGGHTRILKMDFIGHPISTRVSSDLATEHGAQGYVIPDERSARLFKMSSY